MRKLLLFLLMLPLVSLVKAQGISFEKQTTWAKVKQKAKAENKHIFVDVFATWCGPCKWMADNIFPQEHVGEFFNENFVNLKIQMDQTNEDSDDVKSWYEEAKRFGEDYNVTAYPTFLIFNPNGELVHRIVGGAEADEFIEKAKHGLNPETQYVTLVEKFKNNKNDVTLAKNLAQAAINIGDEEVADEAISTFVKLAGEKELLKEENIEILVEAAKSSYSEAFKILRKNKEKADNLLVSASIFTSSNDILASVVVYEKLIKLLQEENAVVDFNQVKKELETTYPDINTASTLLTARLQISAQQQNWTELNAAMNEYLANTDSDMLNSELLNENAWIIFQTVEDKNVLKSALAWSEKSIQLYENAAYIDTYANLLYKLGDKKNAITWQEKAVKMTEGEDQQLLKDTLNKMKKGQPTWE